MARFFLVQSIFFFKKKWFGVAVESGASSFEEVDAAQGIGCREAVVLHFQLCRYSAEWHCALQGAGALHWRCVVIVKVV